MLAVVPQENSDDYFEIVVHAAGQDGEPPERAIPARAQATPPGYFSLMDMPVILGRDFGDPLHEDRTSVVIGAASANPLAQAAWLGALFFVAALPSCFVWLAFGAAVQRTLQSPRRLRTFNVVMGALLALSIALIVR